MSIDQLTKEPPKNRVPMILACVAVGVVAFGAGMLLESQLAARTAAQAAAAAKLARDQDVKQLEDKAEREKQALTDSLAKEREEHEKDIQAKDTSLSATTKRAAGVRHALEADLSAARASGDACTSRIAGISQALGGVFDSIGEVTGIAQDLGRENQQLKADNQSLSEKLAGWQKWNTERPQRVTVLSQKKG
jgi:Sec-independent protein translocase protein TatA